MSRKDDIVLPVDLPDREEMVATAYDGVSPGLAAEMHWADALRWYHGYRDKGGTGTAREFAEELDGRP